MAYQTFTWCPLLDPTGQFRFRVLSAQFGDGYAQEVGDGINNKITSWPLEFMGLRSEMSQIIDFFDDHFGYLPFEWTPPMGSSPRLFVVREYTMQASGANIYRVVATFEERFAP